MARAGPAARSSATGNRSNRPRTRLLPNQPFLPGVATCGYNSEVTSTGIRELKDNLSRYIRRIEAGERIAITAHGRVVAELVPPGAKTAGTKAAAR